MSPPRSTGGAQASVVRSDAATSPVAVPTSSCRRVKRHGRGREEAVARADGSDAANARLVAATRDRADVVFSG